MSALPTAPAAPDPRARPATWRATARPLLGLCLALFVWNFAEFAQAFFRDPAWQAVLLAAACLAPAFLFSAVARYLGVHERFRRARALLYPLAGLLAAANVAPLALPALRAAAAAPAWALVSLAVPFPFTATAVWLLRRAWVAAPDRQERNRLAYALAALVVSIAARAPLFLPDPPTLLLLLARAGSPLAALLLGYAILRHHLLDLEVALGRSLLLLALCAAATLGYFASFRYLPGHLDLALFLALCLSGLLFGAFRALLGAWHAEAERTRRLAALGAMAAGVAHEIRNPLAAISGALQYIQEEVRALPPAGAEDAAVAAARAERLRSFCAITVEEIRRLDRLVEEMRSVTQPLELRPQRVRLNDLVSSVLALLAHGLGPGVALAADLDPRVAEIEADPELLRSALINLVKNAAEAQPDGGEVRVATRVLSGVAGGGGPAPAVELEVADRGGGVPPAERERLFEPYVTTKPGGSGLGLAIVQRVVEAHRGRIEWAARPGGGSRFLVSLPVSSHLGK
ncbi:MAG: hypothetical protein HZA54_04050 [Planctomycetes bacterium]|nr:hypothetical protein [Planctomycetota bacterium]